MKLNFLKPSFHGVTVYDKASTVHCQPTKERGLGPVTLLLFLDCDNLSFALTSDLKQHVYHYTYQS